MYVPDPRRSRHLLSARAPCALTLAAQLPDLPCWVETRALLLSGAAIVRRSAASGGAVVLDPALPSGFLVGRPDATLLRDVLGDAPPRFELFVQAAAQDGASAALPEWEVATATVFSPRTPWRAPGDGAARQPDVVVSDPPEPHWLALVPEADEVRFYAALSEAIALRVVDGAVVAVCAAGDVTQTLWDVGIDTVAGHRRRGHGAAAFRALAAHMAATGRQPVWCAEDDNVASQSMAARLGFAPAGRIAILRRGK